MKKIMAKNFVIRVDSGREIGFGHGMRCLTIANEIKKKEFNVLIIMNRERNNLGELFKKNGHDVSYIINRKIGFKKIDVKYDLEQTKRILQKFKEKIDIFLIDHYNIDYKWEKSLRQYVRKIVVIDDLNNRKHDCDLIIDQGLHHNMKNLYVKLVPKNCKILTGPKYAILRPEFHIFRKKLQKQNKIIKRIMISFGGSDPNNDTIKVLEGITKIKDREFSIDVIVGKANSSHAKIQKICEKMKKTRCYYNPEKMAKIMSKCDLAIGSGGSTTWERCCLGIPSIVSIASEDQYEATRILNSKKCIKNLGMSKKKLGSDYVIAIEDMNFKKLNEMRKECLKLVDGNGTKRIMQNILSM